DSSGWEALCDCMARLESAGKKKQAHREPRGPSQTRSPAAKPNTGESETALLSHRTEPTAAENALQKINSSGPKKSKYLINLRRAGEEDE
ncbi:Pol polyprotein, partial [Dissostichus eleginoides]